MINWKTIVGILIIFCASQQLLIANAKYRTGRLDASPISIGTIFILIVALGVFLIVKGLRKNQPSQ
jgi:hypothetical protein